MLWTKVKQLAGRVPKVGDPVWWASKQVGLRIVEVGPSRYVAVGGEIVRTRRSGRLIPRWTLTALHKSTIWHEKLGMWIVGHGPYPRTNPLNTRVITPAVVQADADVLKHITREEH